MDDADTAHRVTDEVADVLAYLLQFCEVLGIDRSPRSTRRSTGTSEVSGAGGVVTAGTSQEPGQFQVAQQFRWPGWPGQFRVFG